MKKYIVQLWHKGRYDEYFVCQADDVAHAKEQAQDANPDDIIGAVFEEVK